MERRKRKTMTLTEKSEIIAAYDAYRGPRTELARKLGLPTSTLSTLIKNRESIENNAAKFGSFARNRKSLRRSPYAELETILADWFRQAQANNMQINGTLLKEKAMEIAKTLSMNEFSASNGWIDRFKRRHDTVYKSLVTEKRNVDPSVIEDWKTTELGAHVEGYSTRDIFNAGETGIFFNLLPDKIMAVRGETSNDNKHNIERLTVLLCCNADGSEKLPPLIIGKDEQPRCFTNIRTLPTEYASNAKAWMTPKIFETYLLKLDAQLKEDNRKIVLFVDQCTAHTQKIVLENIKLIYFPAFTENLLQPLSLGIIHALKFHYRKELVRKAVAMMECGRIDDTSALCIDILEAMHMIVASWRQVSCTTISNCFYKAGFKLQSIKQEELKTANDMEDEEWNLIKPSVSFVEYITCDVDVLTCDDHSADDNSVHNEQLTGQKHKHYSTEEDEPPTFQSALNGLEAVKKYVRMHEVNESVLVNLQNIETLLFDLKRKEIKTKS